MSKAGYFVLGDTYSDNVLSVLLLVFLILCVFVFLPSFTNPVVSSNILRFFYISVAFSWKLLYNFI